jgi:DNA-binding NarL/FixJ family response regulator
VTRRRVLIAEDQTLIRLDLDRLLDAAGFDVCALARDGEEAVGLALQHRPDVIVLDVDMPRLDGIEAARRILAAGHVPIVLLTAYGYGELVSRAIDVGVVGFVVKPFKESELVDAVRAADGAVTREPGLTTFVGQQDRR